MCVQSLLDQQVSSVYRLCVTVLINLVLTFELGKLGECAVTASCNFAVLVCSCSFAGVLVCWSCKQRLELVYSYLHCRVSKESATAAGSVCMRRPGLPQACGCACSPAAILRLRLARLRSALAAAPGLLAHALPTETVEASLLV